MADVEKFKKGLILDPQSSDPTGAAGQLVYNSTDTTLKFRSEERRVGKESRSRWSPDQ